MKSLIIALIALSSSLACAQKKDFSQIKFDHFTASPIGTSPSLSREDFKGKVVLMDFWASWCEPCKEALPHYNELYGKFKGQGLLIVGINEDDGEKERDLFLKKQKIDFPIFADKDRKMAQVFKVTALPALFVFNKSGKIVAVLHGFSPENAKTLEKKITDLLK